MKNGIYLFSVLTSISLASNFGAQQTAAFNQRLTQQQMMNYNVPNPNPDLNYIGYKGDAPPVEFSAHVDESHPSRLTSKADNGIEINRNFSDFDSITVDLKSSLPGYQKVYLTNNQLTFVDLNGALTVYNCINGRSHCSTSYQGDTIPFSEDSVKKILITCDETKSYADNNWHNASYAIIALGSILTIVGFADQNNDNYPLIPVGILGLLGFGTGMIINLNTSPKYDAGISQFNFVKAHENPNHETKGN